MFTGQFDAESCKKARKWAKNDQGKWVRTNPEREDAKRFKASTQKIIDRLMQGPATNAELSKISLKYTSRISDARKRGFVISCTRKNNVGLTEYKIVV